ncbi:MAG: glycosyltransferase [Bacteroidales bacterium]|nr:glycosyltransferase [Bacteroidales bacterium]
MEKKKLLFIMDTLGTGGGEKSLVSFLNNLDYDRFEVDLQLMSSGGEYERYVSDKVNILPNPEYFRYLKGERRGTFRMKLGRLMYSLSLRFGPNLRMTHARKFWTTVGPCIERNPKEYDVAIGFSQCIPTFYMIDKVSSKQKIAWVNCVFHLDTQEKERLWEKPYYQKADKISLVSEAALEHFRKVYPDIAGKMYFTPNIIDRKMMEDQAREDIAFPDSWKGYSGTKILTVASLNTKDKGYDIVMQTCRILSERNLDFRWYAIGRGPYRGQMEAFIKEHGLQDRFFFLGTMPNPYPYFKGCTVYVQTSRHEGYGRSIAEARLFNKPVVTTRYDAVDMQMKDGKNGLVTSFDPNDVADAVCRLCQDKALYSSIEEYQKTEKKGTEENIEKLYSLMGEKA